MLYVVVVVGALLGSVLVFWAVAPPVAVLLAPVRWVLEKRGVTFDPDEDDDPNTRRMAAAMLGLSTGLGILAAISGGGLLLLGRVPWAPAAAAALAGGIVAARLEKRGFPGMSVVPLLAASGVVAALCGCSAALVAS